MELFTYLLLCTILACVRSEKGRKAKDSVVDFLSSIFTCRQQTCIHTGVLFYWMQCYQTLSDTECYMYWLSRSSVYKENIYVIYLVCWVVGFYAIFNNKGLSQRSVHLIGIAGFSSINGAKKQTAASHESDVWDNSKYRNFIIVQLLSRIRQHSQWKFPTWQSWSFVMVQSLC